MAPTLRKERKSGGARNGPAGIYGVINNTGSEELELPVLYFAEGQENLQTNIMDCKELWSIYGPMEMLVDFLIMESIMNRSQLKGQLFQMELLTKRRLHWETLQD